MKQALWPLNSSLVIIGIITLFALLFFSVSVPPRPHSLTYPPETKRKTTEISASAIEKIYKNDLFNTYRPEQAKPFESQVPTVPLLPQAQAAGLFVEESASTLPPLDITLRGIILSEQVEESVALIEDEAGKENRYHVGQQIKDGQMVKIAQDRVILVRTNGQQDTLFLRKQDQKDDLESTDEWQDVIKKISDGVYDIDLDRIQKELPSIGTLLDTLSVTTAFSDDIPIGLSIGKLENKGIGMALGLLEGDVVTSINDIPVGDIQERIKAFEVIASLEQNEKIIIDIIRNAQKLSTQYTFKAIEKKVESSKNDELFKMSKTAKKNQSFNKFNQDHHRDYENSIRDMRARLLENMRKQRQNTRAR